MFSCTHCSEVPSFTLCIACFVGWNYNTSLKPGAMGRTYLVEESIGQYLTELSTKVKPYVTGLLIGQVSVELSFCSFLWIGETPVQQPQGVFASIGVLASVPHNGTTSFGLWEPLPRSSSSRRRAWALPGWHPWMRSGSPHTPVRWELTLGADKGLGGTGGKWGGHKGSQHLCHLKPFLQSDRAFLTTLGTGVLNQE